MNINKDPVMAPPVLVQARPKVRREHPGLAEGCPELLWAMDPKCFVLLPYLLHNLYLQRHPPPLIPPKLV